MVSILDASVGFALESVYDTGVTVARWLEYKSEGLDFKPKRKQGQGLRVGARVARAGRRVTTFQDAGGPAEFEALSKGQGLMWQALMGAGASTLVSAARSTSPRDSTSSRSASRVRACVWVPVWPALGGV